MSINTIKSTKIPIKLLSCGEKLAINVIEVTGPNDGPVVHIQSSVHGTEIQGNLVIYKILKHLESHPINGKITLIPNANPYANIQKAGPYTQGRYNPVSGSNYNRSYTDLFGNKIDQNLLIEAIKSTKNGSFSSKDFKKLIKEKIKSIVSEKIGYGLSEDFFLNIKLQEIAASADICLDLHTGPIACEYIYSNSSQKNEVINKFPFEFIIDIPEKFAGAMDEAFFMNYMHLNKILKELQKPTLNCSSYTVELGSEDHISESLAENYKSKILSYLTQMGSFAPDIFPVYKFNNTKKYIQLEFFKTYYAPTAGHVEYIAKPGSFIKKGELLAKIYRPTFSCTAFNEENIFAKKDSWIINYQNSSTVHEGMELYQVGENAEIISLE